MGSIDISKHQSTVLSSANNKSQQDQGKNSWGTGQLVKKQVHCSTPPPPPLQIVWLDCDLVTCLEFLKLQLKNKFVENFETKKILSEKKPKKDSTRIFPEFRKTKKFDPIFKVKMNKQNWAVMVAQVVQRLTTEPKETVSNPQNLNVINVASVR